MAANLCTPDDVADVWRPLANDAERSRVDRLIGKASALLRQKLPSVDSRIELYSTAPTERAALAPSVVASVVATVVKRFLTNPNGTTHISKTLGGASISYGYALRGDQDVRGELIITDADLDKLAAPVDSKPWLATVTTRHRLAPKYQNPVADEFIVSADGTDSPADTWLGELP